MTPFLRPSIRTRLVALATGSATIALCLVTGVLAVRDYREMRRARTDHVLLQCDLICMNVAPIMGSRDRETTIRLLRTLEELAPIDSVNLRDARGRTVASVGNVEFSDMTSRGWHYLENGDVLVHRPIDYRGKVVGEVVLRASFADVTVQFQERLKTAGSVLAGAVTVSALAAFLLQRGITGSILRMAETAEKVRLDQSVEPCMVEERSDELGVLGKAFNTMLARLRASKLDLDAANQQLERRVVDRTRQLVDEIHRREEVQQELIRARDAAQDASRAKSEFLANMSHELRTPLNAILGFTDLLRQSAAGDERENRQFLDTIQASGEHLLHLMGDMLEASTMESGLAKVEISRFPLKSLFEGVMDSHRTTAESKGLAIDMIWTSPIPDEVETDAGRVRQLLDNLVGNAVKFTEHGHVQVFAGVDERAQTLTIDVSDSGIGIPDDKRQLIFETFSQVDTSVTRKYGGTGLGLALCRHIVRLLGGHLSVRSTEGKGSTFSVVLPLGQRPEGTLAAQEREISVMTRRAPLNRVPGMIPAAVLAAMPYPYVTGPRTERPSTLAASDVAAGEACR